MIIKRCPGCWRKFKTKRGRKKYCCYPCYASVYARGILARIKQKLLGCNFCNKEAAPFYG